jgi:hypothetical protein
MKLYIVGSMRKPIVMHVANQLRDAGFDAFEDWISPGPEADDYWQTYERNRGRSYKEASQGEHAKHVFAFDYKHLMEADAVVVVYPAGKSAHAEMGWFGGWYTGYAQAHADCGYAHAHKPRPVFILLSESPDRFDVMPGNFAYLTGGGIVESVEELIETLRKLE